VGRAEFLIKPLAGGFISRAASSWHNNHNNIGGLSLFNARRKTA